VKSPLTPEGKLKFIHGKPVEVEYACPACGMQLKSKVDEIGEDFPCPTCGALLTVPGHAEMHAWEAREEQSREQQAMLERQRAEEQVRAAQQQRQAIEHQRQTAKEAAAKAEAEAHAGTANWIEIASRVIEILGLLYGLAGGFAFLIGGLQWLGPAESTPGPAQSGAGLLVITGLAGVLAGIVIIGFGAAMRMVAFIGRDVRAMRQIQASRSQQ
jgi:uncharacterized Zn finger protein (UPF0148 family)